MAQTKFITPAELADRWNICGWTVWAMRRRGELPPALRVNRQLRWRLDEIERWEEERTRPSEEFDAVLCERAAKAVRARGQQVKREEEVSALGKSRGRPTKTQQIARRGGTA